MSEALILKGVTAGHGETHVLEGIDLALAQGESLSSRVVRIFLHGAGQRGFRDVAPADAPLGCSHPPQQG